MTTNERMLFPLLALLLLTGCAIGNQHAYHLATPRLTHMGHALVAVAVHDERPDVVKGKKKADFVGLSRGGFGNAFEVTTVSGHPLASDVADRVAHSLAGAGYQTKVVPAAHNRAWSDVLAQLAKTGAPRLVLVRIEEWKSDTYNSTALVYDMTVRVFDRDQKMLGIATVNGRDNLGGNFLDPPGHAKKVVPAAYQAKLEELLNHPSITQALHPEAGAPARPAPPAPNAAPASVEPVALEQAPAS